MKKLILILAFVLFLSAKFIAQNITITDDINYSAENSAVLDVKSTTKGVLVPRLSSTDRGNIDSPVTGLLVFDTNFNAFFYFDGADWRNLSTDIVGSTTNPDQALFSIVNHGGDTVFAVYPNAVEITVDSLSGKEAKGGFAVSGRGASKEIYDYMRVTPDSTRIYVDEGPGKEAKGGFAVSGRGASKGSAMEILRVTNDSVRIFIDTTANGKEAKGGFAISGRGSLKNSDFELFTLSSDSVRIYIDTTSSAKEAKGGFAVSGRGASKSVNDYFKISADSIPEIITTSQPRILWYPSKEAFLTGRVIIESKDSVGKNSLATGYESKAIGDWSQALGYKSVARGNYATAIGKNAIANNLNSFAFGDSAKSLGADSYAFGAGAIAEANGSFSMGSVGRDSLGNTTGNYTVSSGNFSIAIGQGAVASGKGAQTFGVNAVASGDFSLAAGLFTMANSYGMTAIGRFNYYDENWSATEWINDEPVFIVGVGNQLARRNALTVLKNGRLGLRVDVPEYDIQFADSRSGRDVGISRPTSYAGAPFYIGDGTDLSISAGGCSVHENATDVSGGNLMFMSGISRGDGESGIMFYTVTPGSSGSTTDIDPTEKMRIAGNGYVGIGTTIALNTLDVEGSLAVGATYSGGVEAPVNGMIVEGKTGIAVSSPNSYMQVGGSVALPITTVTGNTTLGDLHYTVLIDNSSDVTINLPRVSGKTGRIYIVKKISSSFNVTIDAYGSETIEGLLTKVLSTQNETVVLQSNGSAWYIIN